MKLVIDIPEEEWTRWIVDGEMNANVLSDSLNNCTPLPKGHGRLIDEKDLSLMTVHLIDGIFICDAPTIIEADKAESEGAFDNRGAIIAL